MTFTVVGPAVTTTGRRPALPRLLAEAPDLGSHLARYGPLPLATPTTLQTVREAGLRGKGGAAFPTANKIIAVAAAGPRRVAVANATEGEPLSAKDKALLTHAPHLVLDGLAVAAELVGASRLILCIERANPGVEAAVRHAIRERRDERVEVFTTPRRYLSGQESALTDLINGGRGKPTLERPFQQGANGLPTLVDNVETLAHLALIARYGARWYRELGTPDDPGTTLVTVAGKVDRPGVYEIAHGCRLEDVLAHAGVRERRAVLLGGYYGQWARAEQVRELRLDAVSLSEVGLSLGCGVIAVLDNTVCAVQELARVATWFAASSAGQCGACTWGLRDLAHSASDLNGDRPDPIGPERLLRWATMIEGRGACRLPDGAIGFLRSALEVFSDEIDEHIAGQCRRSRVKVLPCPTPEPWA